MLKKAHFLTVNLTGGFIDTSNKTPQKTGK